jgi:alkylation response protein AidB-like acyl-CoA dehydrogenase
MQLSFTAEEEVFRAQVRDFFEREYPGNLLRKVREGEVLTRADHIHSQQALQARGWFAITWPAAYGGPGWDATRRYIFEEEMDRAGAPNVIPMGVIYVAPVIYTFGTDEQRHRWLPDILHSRAMWAQGYSEPEAGSDLAGLRLHAQREGDHYVLNGTKIWTSYAHWADWIFCLARTSNERRRQDGISFICAEMSSPGMTVHPIITIDGLHHLNRVHFENVRVPVTNRIGEEGKGWHYATFLLQNERLSYAHVSRKKEDLRQLRRLAAATPCDRGGSMLHDPLFARKIAEGEIAVATLEVSVLRVLTAGASLSSAQTSALKIMATETAQRITELFVELSGWHVAPAPDRHAPGWAAQAPAVPVFAAPWTAAYFFERAQTIYGGTTEVQKNILWRTISR